MTDNFVLCQNNIRVSKCEYRALGERCTFPGTMSSDTRGEGKWFCRVHYKQLFMGLTEEQAAEQVRERLGAGKQTDWREAALQAEMARARGQAVTEEETGREGAADALVLVPPVEPP